MLHTPADSPQVGDALCVSEIRRLLKSVFEFKSVFRHVARPV